MNTPHPTIYDYILAVVRQIPRGRVASYGQVAWIVNAPTPRMVGYALAGLPEESDIPWQRVINSQGGISPRGDPQASGGQRKLLEAEGIEFGPDSRVDFSRFGWEGPDPEWLAEYGYTQHPWPGRRYSSPAIRRGRQ